jgi:transposase
MKYIGVDLHSNNSVIVVIDESDHVVCRRRVPNELAKVLATIEPYRGEVAGIAVESTYNWYWLVDGLQAAGYDVSLANPGQMKRYDGLKHTDDDSDAWQLAHLLRLRILPSGYIYPASERPLRDLARRRLQLVRHRTMHILAVENVQARETGGHMTGERIKRLVAEDALGLQANICVIGALNAEIVKLERRLLARLRPRPEYALLNTVPGVGKVLGPTILLETGTVERFASVGNYSSYARCVNSVRISNERKKGEGNRRNGNKYLAWAFVEAANMARRWCPEAKRFHDRKRARTNAVVATKALAHKLARACYHVLKDQRPFDMQRCFG